MDDWRQRVHHPQHARHLAALVAHAVRYRAFELEAVAGAQHGTTIADVEHERSLEHQPRLLALADKHFVRARTRR